MFGHFNKGAFIFSLSLGISLSRGRFTAQENEKLRQNVYDFMTLTAIDSATKLFFTHRFQQEQENIKKLKGLHKFFERIGESVSERVSERASFVAVTLKGKFK